MNEIDFSDEGISKSAPELLQKISDGIEKLMIPDAKSPDPDALNLVLDTLGEFQASPQLLDIKLRQFISDLSDFYYKHSQWWIAKIIYTICKVRGAKKVGLCFSSDVYLLKTNLENLEQISTDPDNLQGTWEERYILLLWLSILVLAPFKLTTITATIPQRLYDLALTYISVAGKERDAATMLLARLLSRPDLITSFLNLFYEQSEREWETYTIFKKTGILSCMAQILHQAQPHDLTKYLPRHLSIIRIEKLSSSRSDNGNSLLQKLIVKNLGRICLCYITKSADEIPEEIEIIIGDLLDIIGNRDTLVRYAVSKAIARICSSIDEDTRSDIIGGVLEELELEDFDFQSEVTNLDPVKTNFDLVSADRWHGAILTVAELFRRKLISLDLIPAISKIIRTSLKFQQQRITYAIGSNVRDASCYVCWSLFRTYRDLPSPVLRGLIEDLTVLSCLDREINIRRAAAAAVQEGIGRHGQAIWSKGDPHDWQTAISLVQILDHFNLGQMKNAFLDVPMKVANLGLYINSFVDYLLELGITCWDPEVRRLSGQALGRFTSKCDKQKREHNLDVILGRGIKNHYYEGDLYALGEIIINTPENELSHSVLLSSLELLQAVSKKIDITVDPEYKHEEIIHLFGSLLMINNKLASSFITDIQFEELYEQMFYICLQAKDLIIKEMKFLASNTKNLPEAIASKWLKLVSSGNVVASASFGYLSFSIIQESIDHIINVILNKTLDHIARAEAVNTLSLAISNAKAVDLTQTFILKSWDVFVSQLDDYTTTEQGDVGSKVRHAVMDALIINKDRFVQYLPPNGLHLFTCEKKLLRIACETIDKLRLTALKALVAFKFEALDDSSVKLPVDLYFTSMDRYFNVMISIFKILLKKVQIDGQYEDMILEFLRGYIYTAGAIFASDKTISVSSNELLNLLSEDSTDDEKLMILNYLMTILKDPLGDGEPIVKLPSKPKPKPRIPKSNDTPKSFKFEKRSSKLLTCCLNVWANILESGLTVPAAFNCKILYIRVFNLHINTISTARISSAIRIFTWLARDGHIKEARLRLIKICTENSMAKFRVLGSEALFEIISEELNECEDDEELERKEQILEIIQSTDWTLDDIPEFKRLSKKLLIE